MSEAPRHALISTPGQLITVIIAAFALPVIAITLIIAYVDNTSRTSAGTDASSDQAVMRRIEPVARLEVSSQAAAAPVAAATPPAAASGAAPEAAAAPPAAVPGTPPAGEAPVQTAAGAMTPTAGAPYTAPATAGTSVGTVAAAAPASADTQQVGKALYGQVCQACHAAGVLGAPKFGDKAAWAPRLKDSMDVVYNYALKGKGAMPPKGGSTAPDADIKAAVDYMVSAVK